MLARQLDLLESNPLGFLRIKLLPARLEGAGCASEGEKVPVTESPDVRQAGVSGPGHHQDREHLCGHPVDEGVCEDGGMT